MGHWDGHTDADAFSVSRAEHPRSIQNAPEPCSQLPTATRRPRRKGCLVWLLPRVDTAYLPLSRLAQSWGACGLPTEWQSSGASCSTASPTPSLTHNRFLKPQPGPPLHVQVALTEGNLIIRELASSVIHILNLSFGGAEHAFLS